MATTDSSVKPTTTIVGSDSRFATTFLSTKYRDRAVAGEVLIDKTTGELYIKRVSDGKIVSFNQNKKTINDLAVELQILLTYHSDFIYPSDNPNAFYLATNYDLVAINNETLYDLTFDNITIPGGPNDINKLSFKISGDSNGFFCKHTTRDSDKSFIEFLTSRYNLFFKNYNGNDPVYNAEHQKFTSDRKWENSNAVLKYDIIVYKDGTSYEYTDVTDYITLNEDSAVMLPDNIYTDLGSFDYAEITIKSISYDKLHFMINYKNTFDTSFNEGYDKFISIDNRLEVTEFIVHRFINNESHVDLYGNETIIGFLDMPHLQQCLAKLNKFIGQTRINISANQPEYACTWFKLNSTK